MDPFAKQKEFSDIAQMALAETQKQGADGAEIVIGAGSGLTVTARLDEIEKIEHEQDKSIDLTVFINHKKGSAESSDFSAGAVKETVKAACDIARFTSIDKYAGLLEKKYMATDIPDLNLYHPWDITVDEAAQIALECESIAKIKNTAINNSDGCMVSTYSGHHLYANTHGFTGSWPWSIHSIDCTLIAETKSGMQRDGWYSKARKQEDLQDIKNIAEEAAKRTLQRLNAKKISTRQCPVIFEAPVASGIFAAFVNAISGDSIYRKASFLLDKIDQQIFADHVHIYERPHLPAAIGSAPFDGEGMATEDRDLVIDGILQGYLLNGYSARRLNMQPTGHAGGVHNLSVNTSGHNLDDLIKQMHKGLLITDLIGFGVNQITGDYSRGATGFWVENGEIQYPVEEITVAGNLLQIYKQIIAVGSDIDLRGNILSGSVLIENMSIAGN